MSDRDRLLDVASRIALIAFLVLALVVLTGEMGQSLRSDYQGSNRGQAEQQEEQALLRCARLDAPEESEAARQCEQRRVYADLSAQRDMARWAEAQARLTTISLIGLGVTIALAWMAWRESRRSADVAERDLTVARRPKLELIADGALVVDEAGRPSLRAHLRNNGGSRAVLAGEGESAFFVLNHPTELLAKSQMPADTWRFGISKTLLDPGEQVAVELRGKAPFGADDLATYAGKRGIVVGLVEILYDDHLDVERVFWSYIGCVAGAPAAILKTTDDEAEADRAEWLRRRMRWRSGGVPQE